MITLKKLMDYSLFISVIISLSNCNLLAQNKSKYEIWKKQNSRNEKSFIVDDKKKFNDFIKLDWKEYKVFKSNYRDTVKKPSKAPILTEKDHARNKITNQFLTKEHISHIGGKPSNPISNIMSYTDERPAVEFNYFGYDLDLPYETVSRLNISNQIDKTVINQIFGTYVKNDYNELIYDLKDVANKTKMNNWGYLILLDDYCEKLLNNENDKYLFMWYILIQSGFDARIGYSENKIYLLLPTNSEIYGTKYLACNNTKYYIYPFNDKSKSNESIYTYDANILNNANKINMQILNSPKLVESQMKKLLTVFYNDKNISISTIINLNLIRYLNTFPQTELKVYFEYSTDFQFLQSLTNSFKKYVVGISEEESANILLRFVQKAQGYETDAEQFSAENYLFPEETIYYNYSDCEDRAIFYAYLIREILDLEVIGLDYPGHVATAVKFHRKIQGDAIYFKNKRFLICDPTYINADIGQCMPNYKNIKPEIIEY